ncbi:hypothetical protein TNCV_2687981 [Trichonephila clavipes]|nr:hypothetical protein TNCV_2687981 [Trichonephila clavipes]
MQVTVVHGSYTVNTEFTQPAAPFLEELSPIQILKTTYRNRGRRQNVAKELTRVLGLTSTKNKVVPTEVVEKPSSRKSSSREVGGKGKEVGDPPPGCSPSKLGKNRAKLYCRLCGVQGYGQQQAYI